MTRIVGVIILVISVVAISVFVNSRTSLPKLLSQAQEIVSNFINPLPTPQEPSLTLVLPTTVFAPGDAINLPYIGDPAQFNRLGVTLKNGAGISVPYWLTLKEGKLGKTLKIETSKKLKNGRYKLLISQEDKPLINTDIYLGTFAINNQKSSYTLGESYSADIVFYNSAGDIICPKDPSFTLINITSGAAVTNRPTGASCDEKTVPYKLAYTPDAVGTYAIKASVEENQSVTIASSVFDVLEAPPSFVIKREGPTVIAADGTYEMKITVAAQDDFEGTLTDFIPADFSVQASSNFALTSPTVTTDPSSIHLRKPFDGENEVTLGFGDRPDNPELERDYNEYGVKDHDGVDFALNDGTPVLAADDGRAIDFPTKLASYGTTVVLEHPWGGRTFYGHLTSGAVKVGQYVKKGDVIGYSGHTGNITGPHLHFGMDLTNSDVNNGYLGKIDPSPYLSENNTLNTSLQKLTWNISMKAGETRSLGYTLTLGDNAQKYGYYYSLAGPLTAATKNNDVVFKEDGTWTLIRK